MSTQINQGSLSAYRRTKSRTCRLGKFTEDIEHYDPQMGHKPGRLQTVPDALSRIPGQHEAEPEHTNWFIEMREGKDDTECNTECDGEESATDELEPKI